MRKIIFLFIVSLLVIASPAYSFWIWSPKTGKWVNPKSAVKPTPAEQLNYALRFYNEGKLKQARTEFNRLIKHYSKSEQAAEAQYFLGAIEEKVGRLYEAYLAYQKVIDKYPFSPRTNKIIQK